MYMKKFFAFLLIFSIMIPVFAEIPKKVYKKNLPQGTFKKTRNGTYVQYDSKGKKIGTYKLNNGELKRTK